MCTAVAFRKKRAYFGRNLDLEGSFGEGVVVAPRNLPIPLKREGTLGRHYALIGMAVLAGNMPLFFDAQNEFGLGMAGLNFPKNAAYLSDMVGAKNVAPFELIPYVLGQCKTVEEAWELLSKVNLINEPFGAGFPLTPLHWMVSDGEKSFVAEPMKDGLKLYDDPVGILTNNPPFPMMQNRLSDYMFLTPEEPSPRALSGMGLENYSRGMGSIGLPGDFSSAGRFVRAAFVRNSLVAEKEEDELKGFFHILRSVAVPRGCMCLKKGVYEETVYSSCCSEGVYYYTTYENSTIHAVDMHRTDLEGTMPAFFPLKKDMEVKFDN